MQYCFAEAAAETTASELYFWYLPEGTALPSGTQTSCDSCTQDLLAVYATYATDSTLKISDTFAAAREVAVSACGTDFAPFVAAATSASPHPLSSARSLVWLAATGVVGVWLLW